MKAILLFLLTATLFTGCESDLPPNPKQPTTVAVWFPHHSVEVRGDKLTTFFTTIIAKEKQLQREIIRCPADSP